MISLHFNIRNPWSHRWHILFTKDHKISQFKALELQANATSDIIGMEFRWTTHQDHAGVFLAMAVLGHEFILNLYDTRHWNHEDNRYEWLA